MFVHNPSGSGVGLQRTKGFAKKGANFRFHFANFFAKMNYAKKCQNFAIFLGATVNCVEKEKLVEFSALIFEVSMPY